MKASELFIKCLENEGINYIFGVPGEENADFCISLDSSMITPLFLMVIAFQSYYIILLLINVNTQIIDSKIRAISLRL